jgi:phosphomannomutase
VLEPKTRIGSPFVIAGMERALARGKKVVCGWEANGGFLTGSDIVKNGKTLRALPTRDAVLPLVGMLLSAHEKGLTLSELFQILPKRFSRAALLKNFPRSTALTIIAKYSPRDANIGEIVFDAHGPQFRSLAGEPVAASDAAIVEAEQIRSGLAGVFSAVRGFAPIRKLNYTDGVRVTFENGDVAHLRPSGNADEFRIYAVADTLARAEEITALGIAEPSGLLRCFERAVSA